MFTSVGCVYVCRVRLRLHGVFTSARCVYACRVCLHLHGVFMSARFVYVLKVCLRLSTMRSRLNVQKKLLKEFLEGILSLY